MGTQSTEVYDLEYFCLTDDNYLIVRRMGNFVQIKPSEFQQFDELSSLDSNGNLIWTSHVFLSKNQVLKGNKIVRLVTQRGTFYLTTGHKLFLEDGSLEAAGNLETGDRLRYNSSFRLDSNVSIGIDKAYVLGTYAAEGSHQEGLSNNEVTGKWRLVWALNFNETIFATKILTSIISAFPGSNCQIDEYSEYTRRTVSCYDKDLVQTFENIGALGLCYNKRVPSCIFSATKKEKAAFLAGLIEGDGTWNKSRIRLKLTSKALIDGAHLLFEDLGIITKLNYQEATEDNKETYSLSISGKYNLKILLSWCSRYWYQYKHLSIIQEYASSKHGNTFHSYKDIEEALKALYPINSTNFSLKSKIPQASIKHMFGSWNQCLKHFGYPVKNSRWHFDHIPKTHTTILSTECGVDLKCNQVLRKDLISVSKDITVYDFTIPDTENFLLNTICSHNSGSQMLLYIGDVWVDEITSLSYTRQTTKQPIYGYASQLWDDVSAGHVIVQGQFSINYKEQGYLWAILRRFKNISTNQALGARVNTKRDAGFDKALGVNSSGATDRRPVWGSNATKVNRASIERIVSGKATRGDQYKFYHDLAGYSTFSIRSPKDKVFEDIVEEFEDQIWTKGLQNDGLNSQIRNPDDSNFDGFDIYVTFGNYEVPTANHTVQKIIDVRLNTQTKTVKIDGEPIQEVYSFMARTTA